MPEFVDVINANGEPQVIPAHWMDTPTLAEGFTLAPRPEPVDVAPVVEPEPEPEPAPEPDEPPRPPTKSSSKDDMQAWLVFGGAPWADVEHLTKDELFARISGDTSPASDPEPTPADAPAKANPKNKE